MFKTSLDSGTATKIRTLVEQVRSELVEGRVESALRTAYRQFAPFIDIDPLVNMLSSWNQAERERLQQLITQDKFAVNRAKVTELFRRFLQEIEEALTAEGFHQTTAKRDSPGDPEPPIIVDKKQILVLYSEGDRAIWRELQKHFSLLRKMEPFYWSDIIQDKPRELEDDFAYLEKWIDVADKVLCLLSPNTLAYPTYPLAERAVQTNKLIPLKLIEVDLGHTIFEPLRSLPSDNRFASQWPDTNAAYVNITQELRRFLQKLANS